MIVSRIFLPGILAILVFASSRAGAASFAPADQRITAHPTHPADVLTREVLVQLVPKCDAAALARSAGARSSPEISYASGYFIFTTPTVVDTPSLAARLATQPGVISADPILAKRRQLKFLPSDSYFTNQWHLLNTGQKGGTPGIDINVTNVWETYRGDGIRIVIVDDGVQHTHFDLQPNYDPTISTNLVEHNGDPLPDIVVDYHGTSCAGIAAARGDNAIGVCGVAFQASLGGIRLFTGGNGSTDADEATAISYKKDLIHIKSNSWGPPDDGATLDGAGPLARAALINATQTGRGGLGTIFLWSAGNGLAALDDANYDSYANSIYAIAVSAVSDQGTQADYSEPGACILVTAPSSSTGQQGITTVDLRGQSGYNYSGVTGDLTNYDYTQNFASSTDDGTSASTAMVAGVTALMLQANTNLTWRDVQEILVRSATKNDPADADWKTNSAGFHFNHKYGAGLVNANAAVNLAAGWTNLPAQTSLSSTQANLSVNIPDGATNITRTFALTNTNLRVEHVTLTANITHPSRGALAITLTSPGGMQSRLAEIHNDPGTNYSNWTFSTVQDWGETSQGTWTVKIANAQADDPLNSGTLKSLILTVYGSLPQTTTPVFRIISVLPTATNTAINFTSATNSMYLVEKRTNLTLGGWATVASNIPAAGATTQVIDSTPIKAATFYRVRLLP